MDIYEAVEGAVHGDRDGAESLIKEFYPEVLGLCQTLLGDGGNAADAAEKAFAEAIRRAGKLSDAADFHGLLLERAAVVCGQAEIPDDYDIAEKAKPPEGMAARICRKKARPKTVTGLDIWRVVVAAALVVIALYCGVELHDRFGGGPEELAPTPYVGAELPAEAEPNPEAGSPAEAPPAALETEPDKTESEPVDTETEPVETETESAATEAEAGSVSESEAEAPTEAEAGTKLININAASAEELDALPGVGEVIAQSIVAYREANGPFGSIEEIKNVSGIGDGKFSDMKSLITVG